MSGSGTVLEIAANCTTGLEKDDLADGKTEIFQHASQGDGYAARAAWILLSIGMWYGICFRGGEIVSQYCDLPGRN